MLALSELGCTVTSENAKQVVKFLGALEGENLDKIPSVQATGVLGWKPGGKFMPGNDEGLVLDCDPTGRGTSSGSSWRPASRPRC